MSMIKCPECGKDVSDKATVCPECGYPILENKETLKKEKIKDLKKKSLLIIPIIVIVIICAIFLKNGSKTEAIVGEWELIGVSTGKNEDGDVNLVTVEDFKKINMTMSGKLTVTEDKKFKMEMADSSSDEGTWKVYVPKEDEKDKNTFAYSLSGKISYLAVIGKSKPNRIFINIVSDDIKDLTFIYEKK